MNDWHLSEQNLRIDRLPPAPDHPAITLSMLRLDLMHPAVSGNKWFKLKYNIEAAKQQGRQTILTFGGAWSNHIAATAAACQAAGLKSIGVIRGELPGTLSATLSQAQKKGMHLHFISRQSYQDKNDPGFLATLMQQYHDPFIIPEGGNNEAGIKGCEEILSPDHKENYSHICCASGTGATLTGLIRSAAITQNILGFPALKNAHYIEQEIKNNLSKSKRYCLWKLFHEYHFGGFAKHTPALTDFMNSFYREYRIPLDIIYTGKMLSGIFDLVKKEYFPAGSHILIIHTGGLQGNASLKKGKLLFA